MKRLRHLIILAIWCTCITIIQRTETFLFRREKPFHQLLNDPYQVKEEVITPQNIFKWLNMKHHVKFKLWTRKNPKWAQEIIIDDLESLRTSNYDTSRLTKIIVHGWAHSANEVSMEDWILALRDAYLRLADLNIIFIDYTMFALPIMYFTAAPDMAAVRLSEFITFLVKNGAAYDHIHLLGYSWGAHVAGVAGSTLNGSLARITGLDPANPTFRLVDNSKRLDKSDAKFVDIIHTGGGPFIGGYLGLEHALGHVDFYPNGGTTQPGCGFHWLHLDEAIECDHARAVWYFVESINSPYGFPACKCSSWDDFVKGYCDCFKKDAVLMGEFTPHSATGIYYLFTRSKSLFGMGPHMNLTLQTETEEEYDPDLLKYDHMYHNFTTSSAREYLTKIVRKSMLKLPPPLTPQHFHVSQEQKTRNSQRFGTEILSKVKRESKQISSILHNQIAGFGTLPSSQKSRTGVTYE